ncbi:MAG: restriction endonuclease subunit S [Odoribacter sp.]|nr:restriction endonuclease subunit S [Odoribacter sp.]
MAQDKDLKTPNVPPLRFPGFTDEWEKITLGEVGTGFNYGLNAPAKEYDGANKYIRITDIEESTGAYSGTDVVSPNGKLSDEYIVNDNDILLARTGASTGKSYLYAPKDGRLYFAGFLIRFNVNLANPYFIYTNLHTRNYWRWVNIMSARSGQPGINSQEYSSYPFYIPSREEQDKIANLIQRLDKRIATQNKIIEDLKKLKSAIRWKIFSDLKNHQTKAIEVGDLLAYEQPSPYIVTNDEYVSDSNIIPVLTANKGFILGYTDEPFGIYQKGDCIIFDDFTMDAKFVTFPFKVKSSAIKILTAKPSVNLRFMFEYLQELDLKSEEHKRHYISEVAKMVVSIPSIDMQNRIASILASIDAKLMIESNLVNRYEEEKQYLLSNMFM